MADRYGFLYQSWLAKSEIRLEQYVLVSDEVLSSIATTERPDGVVAISKQQPLASKSLVDFQCGIVAENLQSPDNLGSLIRSSAAAVPMVYG